MITAVDSSVLYDVLFADPRFGPGSRAALASVHRDGSVVACDVAWAEVAAGFADRREAPSLLQGFGVEYQPLEEHAARAAGAFWRSYRRAGGSRQRILADFLIGAHALHQADRLLTRDRGFYRTYFGALQLLDPTA